MEQIATVASSTPALNTVKPVAPPRGTSQDWSQILQKTLTQIPEVPAVGTAGIPKDVQKIFDYQKKVATWQLNVELVTRVVDAALGVARKIQQGTL